MANYSKVLCDERIVSEPKFDLISMKTHSTATWDMSLGKFIRNLSFLLLGGKDAIRNCKSAVSGASREPG
tara:strand:+ start:663 stop:872 length:210 start_codon:yes stop_codon:yes gene_type:complete